MVLKFSQKVYELEHPSHQLWFYCRKASQHSSVGRESVLSHAVKQWHNRCQIPALLMIVHKYVDQNSSATMLVTKKLADATPKINRRSLVHVDNEACKQGDPPWLFNPGQTSPEIQTRDISGLHFFLKEIIILLWLRFRVHLNKKSFQSMQSNIKE